MDFKRMMRGLAVVVLAVGALTPGHAADEFPFDQELLLDVEPIPPAKRVPVLTVSDDGSTTIDLWCRTVAARVQIEQHAIRIETAPLPEALPLYMSDGQCTETRMQADVEFLAALTQVTDWQRTGDGVVLNGPAELKPLRFRASSH